MRQRESGAEGSPYGRGFRSRNRITGKEKVFGRSFDTVTLCEPEPGTPPPPYPQTTTRPPSPPPPGAQPGSQRVGALGLPPPPAPRTVCSLRLHWAVPVPASKRPGQCPSQHRSGAARPHTPSAHPVQARCQEGNPAGRPGHLVGPCCVAGDGQIGVLQG